MTQIHGTGAAAQAAQTALAGLEATGATLWIAPSLSDLSEGPGAAQAAIEALYLAPLRLAKGLAADLPKAERDASGEPAAARQLILLVERRLLVGGSGAPSARAAMAALMAWAEEAALELAPELRINVLAFSLQDPPDLGPALRWLTSRAIVTGQVIKLGAPPPSTAPFRGDIG